MAENNAERIKLFGVPRRLSGQSGSWMVCVSSRFRTDSPRRSIAAFKGLSAIPEAKISRCKVSTCPFIVNAARLSNVSTGEHE